MMMVACTDDATRIHCLADLSRCAGCPRLQLHGFGVENLLPDCQYQKDSLHEASSSQPSSAVRSGIQPTSCLSEVASIGEPVGWICTCSQRAVQHDAVGTRFCESPPKRGIAVCVVCKAVRHSYHDAAFVYRHRLSPVEQGVATRGQMCRT